MDNLKTRKETPIKQGVKYSRLVQLIGFILFWASIVNWAIGLGLFSNWFMLVSFIVYSVGSLMGAELTLIEEKETDYSNN